MHNTAEPEQVATEPIFSAADQQSTSLSFPAIAGSALPMSDALPVKPVLQPKFGTVIQRAARAPRLTHEATATITALAFEHLKSAWASSTGSPTPKKDQGARPQAVGAVLAFDGTSDAYEGMTNHNIHGEMMAISAFLADKSDQVDTTDPDHIQQYLESHEHELESDSPSCFMCASVQGLLGINFHAKDLNMYERWGIPPFLLSSPAMVQLLVGQKAYALIKQYSAQTQQSIVRDLIGNIHALHSGDLKAMAQEYKLG